MTIQSYIRAVRDLYIQLPITAGRFNRADRLLAADLFQRQIPIELIHAALLLAAARRLLARHPSLPPLPLVRSLHYFLPLIDELRVTPLPPGYIRYIESKIQSTNRKPSLEKMP